MPIGDADRIHKHCENLAREARDAGEDTVSIRVGDVRDALDLRYSDAAIDICQALDTRKFRVNGRVEFIRKTGPKQGMSTVYRFRVLR